MKTALVLAMVLTGFFAEDSKKPAPKQLTAADQGKTVKIATNKLFDIALEGNATTGFLWQVDKVDGDSVMQQGKPDYIQEKNTGMRVGAGGTFVFHFKVVKPGKTKIKLSYLRPWEKNKPAEKTFETEIDSR
jgi:inhibitor of cysteine peptidase